MYVNYLSYYLKIVEHELKNNIRFHNRTKMKNTFSIKIFTDNFFNYQYTRFYKTVFM